VKRPHSSLTAPFAAPDELHPQVTMGRNERCWCGSGHKWMVCHKDRELQPPVNFFEAADDMREEFARGYCSDPEKGPGICGPVISAHTGVR
jgi:hypothetical protein